MFPLVLPHCRPTTLTYVVTVVNPLNVLFVNVWFDWNRDGDWDDVQLCGLNDFAPEWSVQNQQLAFAGPGQYPVTTLPFKPWHPTTGQDPIPIWMRITLSEQLWISSGGPGEGSSGPQQGYQYGETEDYYVEDYIWDITPPTILDSWLSVLQHGTVGLFGIPLNQTANTQNGASVEPRIFTGTPVYPMKLRCTFSEAVSVPAGSVQATGINNPGPYIPTIALVSGNQYEFTFATPLPNMDRYTITVSTAVTDLAGNALGGDRDVQMAVLQGNVNNTGLSAHKVNATDRTDVAARNGQATTAVNFKYDVQGRGLSGGKINSTDRSDTAARNGNQSP
ncbi:MAG: Ig-like domain-containing protein [Planctomycetota bacterium]